MNPPSAYRKPSVTDPKEMQIRNCLTRIQNNYFKMLRELKESKGRQVNNIRKTVKEEKEKFNNAIENIRKNQ